MLRGDCVRDGSPRVEAYPHRFGGERREVKYIVSIIQAILIEQWEISTGGNTVV